MQEWVKSAIFVFAGIGGIGGLKAGYEWKKAYDEKQAEEGRRRQRLDDLDVHKGECNTERKGLRTDVDTLIERTRKLK